MISSFCEISNLKIRISAKPKAAATDHQLCTPILKKGFGRNSPCPAQITSRGKEHPRRILKAKKT